MISLALGLDRARRDAGISRAILWVRYFALGGSATTAEFDEQMRGEVEMSRYQYNVVALALNEEVAERGGEPSVPYLD